MSTSFGFGRRNRNFRTYIIIAYKVNTITAHCESCCVTDIHKIKLNSGLTFSSILYSVQSCVLNGIVSWNKMTFCQFYCTAAWNLLIIRWRIENFKIFVLLKNMGFAVSCILRYFAMKSTCKRRTFFTATVDFFSPTGNPPSAYKQL
jgi:hypothetical protein